MPRRFRTPGLPVSHLPVPTEPRPHEHDDMPRVTVSTSAARRLYTFYDMESLWPAQGLLLGTQRGHHWTVQALLPALLAPPETLHRFLHEVQVQQPALTPVGTWHSWGGIRATGLNHLHPGPLHLVVDVDGTLRCLHGHTDLPVYVHENIRPGTVRLHTDALSALRRLAPHSATDQGLLIGHRTSLSYVVEHVYPIDTARSLSILLDADVANSLGIPDEDVLGLYRLHTRPFHPYFYRANLIAITEQGIELTWRRGARQTPQAIMGAAPIPVVIPDGLAETE